MTTANIIEALDQTNKAIKFRTPLDSELYFGVEAFLVEKHGYASPAIWAVVRIHEPAGFDPNEGQLVSLVGKNRPVPLSTLWVRA